MDVRILPPQQRARNGWKMSQFCVSVVFFLSLCFVTALTHTCSHIPPKPHEVVHNVPLGEEADHVIRKRSLDQQLRIHLVYDDSISALDDDRQRLIRYELIPSAVSYWENTLQVRHTGGPIKLLRQCQSEKVRYKDGDPYPYCVDGCNITTMCGETMVPGDHLEACRYMQPGGTFSSQGYKGIGVSGADFVLYISAHTTQRCGVGTTVAYAAYCQLERVYDRPIAGYVNLCPDAISAKAHDLHQMESTIKHEILHALGFSAGLYAFFRSPDGEPLTRRSNATGKPPFNQKLQLYQWSDLVVRTVVRSDWKVREGAINKTIHMLITPNVKREVRRHFGCDSLEGAELEDQGVIGTAITHWEKRVFENEVMTGTYTQSPLVSRITLALMEDTGWYRVDYNRAEPFYWGQSLGCDFVTKSCKEWMDIRRARGAHIHPYCDRAKQPGGLHTECTESRDAVALCNLVKYAQELPQKYQHFEFIPGVKDKDVQKYGGTVVLADYCPYIQELNWKQGETVIRGSRCQIHQNNADPEINYTLEKYGNQSTCFDHKDVWTLDHCDNTYDVEHWGSGCYQYSCQPSTGLHIFIHGQEFQCYQTGQILKVQATTEEWLHQGTVVCPPCKEICEPQGVECPAEAPPPLRSKVKPQVPCSMATVAIASSLTWLLPSILLVWPKLYCSLQYCL